MSAKQVANVVLMVLMFYVIETDPAEIDLRDVMQIILFSAGYIVGWMLELKGSKFSE